MNKEKQLKSLKVIFFYLILTLCSLLYKVEWFNQFDWGINYEYWDTNTEFLSHTMFWLNMFLFSLAPLLMSRYFQFNKLASWLSLGLPLYWFQLLMLQMVNEFFNGGELIIKQTHSEFVYLLVMLATVALGIQLFFLARSVRKERKLENLSKFKERAMKKLYLLNPEANEKLLKDLLGEHGDALNLLMAANLEENSHDKQRLVKLALNELSRSKNSLEDLQKKLLRISTFSDLRKSPL